MRFYDPDGQITMFTLDEPLKLCKNAAKQSRKSRNIASLIAISYFHLDLSKEHVDLFGAHYWEMRSRGWKTALFSIPEQPQRADQKRSIQCFGARSGREIWFKQKSLSRYTTQSKRARKAAAGAVEVGFDGPGGPDPDGLSDNGDESLPHQPEG